MIIPATYIAISLVVTFLYARLDGDTELTGAMMLGILWPIMLPLAVIIVPFYLAAKLGRRERVVGPRALWLIPQWIGIILAYPLVYAGFRIGFASDWCGKQARKPLI